MTHYNVFIVLEVDDPVDRRITWHAVETTTNGRRARQIVNVLRKQAEVEVGHKPQELDE